MYFILYSNTLKRSKIKIQYRARLLTELHLRRNRNEAGQTFFKYYSVQEIPDGG